MYDAPVAVLRPPECACPPTTRLWALDSHEPATDILPAVVDDPPTAELHLGLVPQWPTVDPDNDDAAAAETRCVLRRHYATDTATLDRLLRGLQRLVA
ncbi:hypothetical protein [Saccharomonospora azurea]|uniref:hypothetical protein n=1 Tax=Saccharomonospora azurea TaxID=40988 RepID=UPI003D8BEA56